MYILPTNIYLLLPFIFFQGFLVFIVIYFFIERFVSLKKYRVEHQLVKEAAYKEAEQVLESARIKAQEELKLSHNKSIEMVSQAEVLTSVLKTSAEDAFRKMLAKQDLEFSNLMEILAKDMTASFEKEKITSLAGYAEAIDTVKAELLKHVGSYQEILVKSMSNLDETVSAQIQQSLKTAISKIDAYEKEKMREVDARIFDIIRRLSVDILGNDMSSTANERFILDSLEKAKVTEVLKS